MINYRVRPHPPPLGLNQEVCLSLIILRQVIIDPELGTAALALADLGS